MYKRNFNTTTTLNISDRSIEMVEMKRLHNGLKLLGTVRVILPSGTIRNGKIIDNKEFDSEFNNLLDKAETKGFSFDNFILSLPEEFIEHHVVSIDNVTTGENIEKLVLDKLNNKYTKYSDKWRYEIYEITINGEKKYLFFGIEEDLLYKYVKRIAEFGLNIMVTEPESSALIRHLPQTESANWLIDFGTYSTFLYLELNGLVHKRRIIQFGAYDIITTLSKNSKLSFDKEEKFFERIGYGNRASHAQKNIIEKYFQKFIDELNNHLDNISKEFGISKPQRIYITGGLSNMTGISKLFPHLKLTRLQAQISDPQLIDKFFINPIGSSFRLLYDDLITSDINFLTKEIKKKIKKEIDDELNAQKENLTKTQIAQKNNIKTKEKLKKIFLEKWGEQETSTGKWRLSFKKTKFSQIFCFIIFGLVILSFLVSNLASQQVEYTQKENQFAYNTALRDYFTYSFPIVVSSGIDTTVTNAAIIIGRFENYVVEVTDTFFIDNDTNTLTQEDVELARSKLEARIRKGEKYEEYISLDGSEFFIPEAVTYEESLAAPDKAVGMNTVNFKMTVKAKVKFAITSTQKLNIIIKQNLLKYIRPSEEKNQDKYKLKPVAFQLISNSITNDDVYQFNLYIEAEL